MLNATSLNDLMQLEADFQMLEAALAPILATLPSLPIGTTDPMKRVQAVHQKVLDFISNENNDTMATLQAKLKRAQDDLRAARQQLAQDALANS